jgi:methylated-DNA-[protein]-cysteine S-methyltransferase
VAVAAGASLFNTALGECAIAWSTRGVVGLQLPEADPARTCERLHRRNACAFDAPVPAAVRRAIDGVQRLLQGERIDLRDVALDLTNVSALHQHTYAITREIPAGATATYGEIAGRLGDPLLARTVGQALARNPIAIIVPCHRVLAAGGRSGGFSAGGGVHTKLRLLAIEGARTSGTFDLFSSMEHGAAGEKAA